MNELITSLSARDTASRTDATMAPLIEETLGRMLHPTHKALRRLIVRVGREQLRTQWMLSEMFTVLVQQIVLTAAPGMSEQKQRELKDTIRAQLEKVIFEIREEGWRFAERQLKWNEAEEPD